MTRIYYDEDVPMGALSQESIAVLGYGIQAQAYLMNFRDEGHEVLLGCDDSHHQERAKEDGFSPLSLEAATQQANIIFYLLSDGFHQPTFAQVIRPFLQPGAALVLTEGAPFLTGALQAPKHLDLLLLSPRMSGQYIRQRYVDGWGAPAYISVEQDATGRAWQRLLGLAQSQGFTRCAAFATTAAKEAELEHFSKHFTSPLLFRSLELTLLTLLDAGYDPDLAFMELHHVGEFGAILSAAARAGFYQHTKDGTLSPSAQQWQAVMGPESDVRQRIRLRLTNAQRPPLSPKLQEQQEQAQRELERWHEAGMTRLTPTEQQCMRPPPQEGPRPKIDA